MVWQAGLKSVSNSLASRSEAGFKQFGFGWFLNYSVPSRFQVGLGCSWMPSC